ncbi:DinB family protein [Kribbella qitaiheensis]|uniref:DinB family protein n=1 Tax=Kribbella qitaiheensis TaxID=1544730 RepID=A0A7G6X4X5_9ACTN|nr:DinB family protein [Kribbella qitaiheensis]QNE21290.1 DinB family protein [Kribbella qitaiheensis]
MEAQYGPHRFSGGGDETTQYRGATFEVADLRGATYRDCDLSGVRIIDSMLIDVEISGYLSNLVVNGVDVTAFVEGELDRRHPERVQLRSIGSADDFRAMWTTIERLWAETTARAGQLPDPVRRPVDNSVPAGEKSVNFARKDRGQHERVDGEWSFAETLRHLVFITDAWASRTILDAERPYHPLGITQGWYRPADAAALGIDHDASPSYAEVLAVRGDRMAVIRGILDELTDSELGRFCVRTPAPGYPEEARPVSECLWVVMEEEIEHHRYAIRDLGRLEASLSQ